MASSDKAPTPNPAQGGDNYMTPGKMMGMGQHMLDKGAEMLQSLKPVNQMSQHVCTFALYSHDPTRQVETHHYVHRLNQDFLQCAVYDSDGSHGRLIGVEYIVSDRIFENLPPEEQKLWHSHAYEIKAGLCTTRKSTLGDETDSSFKIRFSSSNILGDENFVAPHSSPNLHNLIFKATNRTVSWSNNRLDDETHIRRLSGYYLGRQIDISSSIVMSTKTTNMCFVV